MNPALPAEPFVRASDWLSRNGPDPRLVVLGAPFAGGSISRARCDLAPAKIRETLARFSTFSSDENVDLERLVARDAGDVSLAMADVAEASEAVADAVRGTGAETVVLLGGDNSVTYGGVVGAGAGALLAFDAHHDCRPAQDGRSNGSVVRDLIESGVLRAGRVSQIGIHGFANAPAHAEWARRAEIASITARTVRARGIDTIVGEAMSRLEGSRIWVDVDLDCLDRAFAPGAPAALPGGLAPGDLERAAYLLGRHRDVVGLDLTEFDPTQDVADITARAACAVMLAFCAGVAGR